MFIGVYELEGKTNFGIYFTGKNAIPYNAGWDLWHEETFSPEVNIIGILDFKISGKTYEERKASAEDLAKEWQLYYSYYEWSYGELGAIYDYFKTIGKRYGLLRVFKENGIC